MKYMSQMPDDTRAALLDPANEAAIRENIRGEWMFRLAIWLTQKRLGVPFGRALVIVLTEAEKKALKKGRL